MLVERGNNLLIENEIIEEEVDVEDPTFDEGNDGEILFEHVNKVVIVRKSLLATKDNSRGDWLRANIFHTICTIGEHVCKVIIKGAYRVCDFG